MSLSWNLSKIKGSETLCWERRTQAELDAEGRGETLEGLASRMSFFGCDWYFPNRASPLEQLADTTKERHIERMSPLTHTLVTATMSINLGRITEDNYVDFYTRLCCLEQVYGSLLSSAGQDGQRQPRPITLEEVRAHIGLTCNVADTTWFSFSQDLALRMREKVLKEAGLQQRAPLDSAQNASLHAKNCIESLSQIKLGIGNMRHMSDEDSVSESLDDCDKKLLRVRRQVEELLQHLEDVELSVGDDDEVDE